MSLNSLLFDYNGFLAAYNCTALRKAQTRTERSGCSFTGFSYLALSVLFVVLYIPCVIAMLKRRVRAQICYRLMLYLGIVEILSLSINGIAIGVISTMGIAYCDQPVLVHTLTLIGTSLWCTVSSAILVLAINRCMMISNTNVSQRLFNGDVACLMWMSIPTIAGLGAAWFVPPLVYSALRATEPTTQHLAGESDSYPVSFYTYYNIIVLISVITIYSVFLAMVFRKIYFSTNSESGRLTTLHQREVNTFLQVFINCLFLVICIIGYLFQQRYEDNVVLEQVATYGYIIYQGSPSVVYLCMNQTIRTELRQMFRSRTIHPEGTQKYRSKPNAPQLS
ncbi:serpentine type 7TM GPCR chemoreceptor srt domain-containing protein [Ditylenchus destructor]|uniref:Serpentine type 7TM GPCR chemoreceptor srt domain-containing protein n=1 Tax=Ditylenchus destructor TaxID=166010 RepID=A0AAD4MZF1_9BILA|nr:serpentine type 7TM GPCR chemoreceptor srt domain-containing protein [Ditylenchus destructor]